MRRYVGGGAVEYVDDPRAAEEAEALQAMAARLKGEMADADQERPDLAEELGLARSRMDFLGNQLQRARLLLVHGGVRFELGDESEGTRL